MTAILLLAALPASAWISGSFRGVIVEPAASAVRERGWLYVQGANHMLRRVAVAKARVVYGPEVPAGLRRGHPDSALVAGTEIRVTAEQDGDGEWRASLIEILKLPSGPGRTNSADSQPKNFQASKATFLASNKQNP